MATAAAPAPGERSVSIGRTMSRGWSAIGTNPGVLFGVALLFSGLPMLVMSSFTQRYQAALTRDPGSDAIWGYMSLTLGSAVVGIVLAALVQGAVVHATIAASEGRRASFGETVAFGLRMALPLVGLALIVGICAMFGLLLLFVPGVMIYVIWAVSAPALVEERLGIFVALGRSASLTKGARWRVFGLLLVLVVMYWMASSVMSGIFIATAGLEGMANLTRDGMPLWWLVSSGLLGTLVNMVWAVMIASLYIELRDFKDGPDANKLEDIFA